MIKIAINGYGRIGKMILRSLYENKRNNEFQIVAINSYGGDPKVFAHLTQFDSIHGKFNSEVSHDETNLIVNGDSIKLFSEMSPENLPWAELGIDIVFECTGKFTSKSKAISHINAGAKKVLISAPGGSDVDATIVYGVNHHIITKDMVVVSNASCTTNCLAPVAKILDDNIGITSGLMTTIHSYTGDQLLLDGIHQDLHRARAASMSMIPTKTGAAAAIGLVLPSLAGKLDGLSIRVPTPNVSLIDLTFQAKRDTTIEEINKLLKDASNTYLKGVLSINELPLVSIDFNHNSSSSTADLSQTKVLGGTLVKVFSWYDNEWGFSCRMLDTAKVLFKA